MADSKVPAANSFGSLPEPATSRTSPLYSTTEWMARTTHLDSRAAAELRWVPQLEELHAWMEEYRVSLYAQELKTLGPVSAARLAARAAEVDSWLNR